MAVSGRNFDKDAVVYVNGRRVEGSVELTDDEQEQVIIELESLPEPGMHLLQVQTLEGLFSNDFIFHVAANEEAAVALQRAIDEPHSQELGPENPLARAVSRGDLPETTRLLGDAAQINERLGRDGVTLLGTAALYGQLEVAKLLIEHGAKVDVTNRDGNSPLHIAAFLCRQEIVQLLLENGASVSQKNDRGDTPIDGVSGPWNDGLANFYRSLASGGIPIDLKQVEQDRPKMAELLRDWNDESH
jgi:Ankyrin repeats (3 copies)